MKADLQKFFEENPEATECHIALGFFHTEKEEAESQLKGVRGHEVKTVTKEEFEKMSDKVEEPKAKDHKLIAAFKKVPVEKMPTLIEQQKNLVARLETQQKAADDADKAMKALNFHDGILKAMQEAFEAKSKEGKQ